MSSFPPSRRANASWAVLALLLWTCVGVAGPALHAIADGHGHHASHAPHAPAVSAACGDHCDDPAHHHDGHDHAGCPTCRILKSPIAAACRVPRAFAESALRFEITATTPVLPAGRVSPFAPRGPPAPLS